MKHIKRDYSIQGPVSHPLGGLKGWGQKVKIQLCQNTVMLRIKLKGITNASAWWQIFCSQTPTHHPDPGVGDKRSKFHSFRTWCCISN